jgi:hypothetical protein
MQSIRKMALVPHGMVDQLFQKQQLLSDEPIVQLSGLDAELQRILKDTSVPSDQKAKLYNQALEQYSVIRNKHINPKPIEQPEDEADHDVLTGVPKQYVKRAQALYNKVKTVPGLKWNDQGEMVFNGERIAGSNIVDLIHTFVKPGRRNSVKPVGWKTFGQKLLESGVPRTIITNKLLWNEVETGQEEKTNARPVTPRRRINHLPAQPIYRGPRWQRL